MHVDFNPLTYISTNNLCMNHNVHVFFHIMSAYVASTWTVLLTYTYQWNPKELYRIHCKIRLKMLCRTFSSLWSDHSELNNGKPVPWFRILTPENGHLSAEEIFKCISPNKNFRFGKKVVEICLKVFNWQYVFLGSGNGLTEPMVTNFHDAMCRHWDDKSLVQMSLIQFTVQT